MQLVVHMEYSAKGSKSGRYRYRRRVPGELTKLIGKREFSVSLKTKDQRVAMDRYKTVHREVEAEIEAARSTDLADVDHKTALQALRRYGLVSPVENSLAPVSFHDRWIDEEAHMI